MDPLLGFAFRVRIGLLEFGFSKVSGLQRESDVLTYQEGGLNDRIHVLPGPVKSCGTLRLERGAYAGEYFPLYLAGERIPDLRIEVWDTVCQKPMGKVYTLVGLVVRKWEAGDLDAQQSALLIDRFELNYEYLSFAIL